jgi:hypothetical protein
MADATAKIRPYTASDRKLVVFKIGKSNMEALAVANSKSKFPSGKRTLLMI